MVHAWATKVIRMNESDAYILKSQGIIGFVLANLRMSELVDANIFISEIPNLTQVAKFNLTCAVKAFNADSEDFFQRFWLSSFNH